MTPQERQLVDDLFDRLAKLETAPREPDAESAIMQGLRRAPNAVYSLVQTALVQDEALKRANARIQELEGAEQEPQPSGGFLDSMRDAILGPGQSRSSVPSVRPGERGPVWNSGQALGNARLNDDSRMNDPRYGGVGSGNAGGGSQQSFGNTADAGTSKSPWDSASSSGNLARDAGVNDIGKSGDSQRQSSYDQAQADADQDQDQDQDDGDYDDDDFDSAGFDDGGDSDFA